MLAIGIVLSDLETIIHDCPDKKSYNTSRALTVRVVLQNRVVPAICVGRAADLVRVVGQLVRNRPAAGYRIIKSCPVIV